MDVEKIVQEFRDSFSHRKLTTEKVTDPAEIEYGITEEEMENWLKEKLTEYGEFKKREAVKNILPENIKPAHLIYWANDIEKKDKYESQLSLTLRCIGKKLKELEGK